MKDPHVTKLRYRAEPSGEVTFIDPPPVEYSTDDFSLRLTDGLLVCEMKGHFPSELLAREAVEPFLLAWQIEAALRRGRDELCFFYQGAEVVDRDNPASGARASHELYSTASIAPAGNLTSTVITKHYPAPPQRFRASPDVISLWVRYDGYRKGREPLSSMAYVCLTLVEASAGNRKQAAKKYEIEEKILRKLGELTSEHYGDRETVRKAKPGRIPKPHTGAEIAWIEAAVKALIRRVGEFDAKSPLPPLTMNGLPPL